MSFKFYKNRLTGHPSVSVSSKDKTRWYNMPISHSKNGNCIPVTNPNKNDTNITYIRKYVRKDQINAKLHKYDRYILENEFEEKIKKYLKNKYKKDEVKPN